MMSMMPGQSMTPSVPESPTTLTPAQVSFVEKYKWPLLIGGAFLLWKILK